MCVVVREKILGIDAQRFCAPQRIGRKAGSRDRLLAVDPICVGGQGMHVRLCVECDCQRQEELHIPPATTFAVNGDRRLATRQQYAWRRERSSALRNVACDCREHLADIARFAIQPSNR